MKHNNYVLILIIIGCLFLTGCMTSKADLETAKIEYLDDTYEVQNIECNEQEQYCRIKYKHTQTGAEDYIDTLGVTCEKGDKGEKGDPGEKGEKGDTGPKGDKGEQGERGAAFDYDDFTPEQLQMLKGEKGDPGVCSCGESDADSSTDENYVVDKGFSVDDISAEEIKELKEALDINTQQENADLNRYIYSGSFNPEEDGDVVSTWRQMKYHWKKIPIEHIKLDNMPHVQVFVKPQYMSHKFPYDTWIDITSNVNEFRTGITFDEGNIYIMYKEYGFDDSKSHINGDWKIILTTSQMPSIRTSQISGCRLLSVEKNKSIEHYGYTITAIYTSEDNPVLFSVVSSDKTAYPTFSAHYGNNEIEKKAFDKITLVQDENECIITPQTIRIWACFDRKEPVKKEKSICPDRELFILRENEELTYFGYKIILTKMDSGIENAWTSQGAVGRFIVTDTEEEKTSFTFTYGDDKDNTETIGDLNIFLEESTCLAEPGRGSVKLCLRNA